MSEEKAQIENKIQELKRKINLCVGEEQEKLHKEIMDLRSQISILISTVKKKEKQEEALYDKFQKLYFEKNKLENKLKKEAH